MNHMPTLRVVRILETVAANNGELTMSDIARRTAIPPSTILPILQTLTGAQFLRFDARTMRYYVGLKTFLSGAVFAKSSTYGGINAIVDSIAKESGETAHFGLLEGGDVLYVIKAESQQHIRMYSEIGRRLPAYATAVGKALLGYHSRAELALLYPDGLKALTEHTITDFDHLAAQLAVVKQGGFAYEWEESNPGISCIARPLVHDGKIVAAFSIVIPTFRSTDELKAKAERILIEASRSAETLLPFADLVSIG